MSINSGTAMIRQAKSGVWRGVRLDSGGHPDDTGRVLASHWASDLRAEELLSYAAGNKQCLVKLGSTVGECVWRNAETEADLYENASDAEKTRIETESGINYLYDFGEGYWWVANAAKDREHTFSCDLEDWGFDSAWMS